MNILKSVVYYDTKCADRFMEYVNNRDWFCMFVSFALSYTLIMVAYEFNMWIGSVLATLILFPVMRTAYRIGIILRKKRLEKTQSG